MNDGRVRVDLDAETAQDVADLLTGVIAVPRDAWAASVAQFVTDLRAAVAEARAAVEPEPETPEAP